MDDRKAPRGDHVQPFQVFRHYSSAIRSESEEFRYCPRCAAPSPTRSNGERLRHPCEGCGNTQYRNPATGVAVLVVDAGRVVVGRRKSALLRGRWSLPAGYVEYEEDFLTAARRETLEETGLEVELLGIVTVCSSFVSLEHHTLVVVLAGRPIGGELRAGDDFDRARWVDLHGPWPPLTPQSHHVVELYRAGDGQLLPIDPRFAGRGE